MSGNYKSMQNAKMLFFKMKKHISLKWEILWSNNLTLFREAFSGLITDVKRRGGGGEGVSKRPPLLNLTHLYLTERRSKKYLNFVTHPLTSAGISIFHLKSANFAISRNTDIDCILIHNLYFFELVLSCWEIV